MQTSYPLRKSSIVQVSSLSSTLSEFPLPLASSKCPEGYMGRNGSYFEVPKRTGSAASTSSSYLSYSMSSMSLTSSPIQEREIAYSPVSPSSPSTATSAERLNALLDLLHYSGSSQ
jgi:hypothetical protein